MQNKPVQLDAADAGAMGLMMIRNTVAMLILSIVTISTVFAGDEGGWIDRAGNPVPNSDAMKSVNGFGGWLVVTAGRKNGTPLPIMLPTLGHWRKFGWEKFLQSCRYLSTLNSTQMGMLEFNVISV